MKSGSSAWVWTKRAVCVFRARQQWLNATSRWAVAHPKQANRLKAANLASRANAVANTVGTEASEASIAVTEGNIGAANGEAATGVIVVGAGVATGVDVVVSGEVTAVAVTEAATGVAAAAVATEVSALVTAAQIGVRAAATVAQTAVSALETGAIAGVMTGDRAVMTGEGATASASTRTRVKP